MTGVRGLDPAAVLTTWERGIRSAATDRAPHLLAAALGRPPEEAAAWDVGSRDAVLASLLTASAGATAWAVTTCAGCGERLDVPVDLAAIAPSPVWEPGKTFDLEMYGQRVAFRLPTSEDLRAVRGMDAELACQELLARCVTAGDVTPEVAAAMDAAMEAVAPAAAVAIAVSCPDCEETTTAALDVGTLLWSRVEAEAMELLREVHVLARAYGWTERDVLALSAERRTAYLALVDA